LGKVWGFMLARKEEGGAVVHRWGTERSRPIDADSTVKNAGEHLVSTDRRKKKKKKKREVESKGAKRRRGGTVRHIRWRKKKQKWKRSEWG